MFITPLCWLDNHWSVILPPLFISVRVMNSHSTAILPPLFIKNATSYHIIWPFNQLDFNNNYYQAFPFFIYDDKGDGEWDLSYMWPLGRHECNQEMEQSYFLPIYYSDHDNNNDKKWQRHFMMPLCWNWGDDKESNYMALPLYYYKKNMEGKSEALMTPLGGWYKDELCSFLGPLFIMDKEKPSQKSWDYNIIWPLNKISFTNKEYYSLPLFYSDRDDDGSGAFNYLLPLGWNQWSDTSILSAFAPFYIYENSQLTDDDGRAYEQGTLTLPCFFNQSEWGQGLL